MTKDALRIIAFLLSLSLQQLEQDRHRLRLQLEVMESEYESRAAELRQDAASARKELRQVKDSTAGEDKERAALSAALREQVRPRKFCLKRKRMDLFYRIIAWLESWRRLLRERPPWPPLWQRSERVLRANGNP